MISLAGQANMQKGRRGSDRGGNQKIFGTALLKRGFAHMQKHGVIMDVTDLKQAHIAEDAGAVAVMVPKPSTPTMSPGKRFRLTSISR